MKLLLSAFIAAILICGPGIFILSAQAEGGSSVRNGKKGAAQTSPTPTPSPSASPEPSPAKP